MTPENDRTFRRPPRCSVADVSVAARVLYCLLPRASITKYHKQSGLTEQKFILSHFWQLEVQDQGVSRVGSF